MSGFVNLHVHTGYSLQDSMIRIPELVAKVKEFGQEACAITDHGTLGGAVKFTQSCLDAGIKPIIGQEFYIAPDDMHRKHYPQGAHTASHLIIFAKNDHGWKNLMKLSTLAWRDGFYKKPRIDRALLGDHADGLIVTSACCGGDIAVHLMKGYDEENAKTNFDPDLALEKFAWYRGIFGDDFYAELQSYGSAAQDGINQWYRSNCGPGNIIATSDCHYLLPADADTHDTLLCTRTASRKDDPARWRFVADQFYLKSEAQVRAEFEANEVDNTVALATKIQFVLPLKKQFFMPELPFTADFRALCWEGFAQIAPPEENLYTQLSYREPLSSVYRDRLEMEMDVYERAGYTEYALLLWDLMRECRKRNIFTGDGRGSGVGSLVLYCLGITKVDPIERDCPFERFINAGRLERFAPPDVDLDFPRSRREEVIAYLRERYGADRVCQIGTYATLGPSALIRSLGAVLGIAHGDIARLTGPIPTGESSLQGAGAAAESSGMTLDDIYDQIEDFRTVIDGLGETGVKLMEYGRGLAKLGTHAGKHASGVLIADRPVDELIPLMLSNDGKLMSQFDMFDAEALGLVKFDILGLSTLDTLHEVQEYVRRTDPDFDFARVDLDDPLPYKLLHEGRTTGIFQAEGGGFGRLLPKTHPRTVEHLAALTSLCRPGPSISGLTDSFVRRIRGEEATTYDLPAFEPVLNRTYGIITYQEDIMAIAHECAGYTLAEADDLRKIMGKKQRDKMPYQHDKFVSGLSEITGCSADKAEVVWKQIESMSEYVFNRGHAMAYSYLTAKCAYAKAYYPAPFIAATMSQEAEDDSKQLPALLNDARWMGVTLLPPDINHSAAGFTALDATTILMGLRSIRGVGEKAVDAIISARDAGGPYDNAEALGKRLEARTCNKTVKAALERAGAFDALSGRKRLSTVDRLLEEFELFGFFLSGHPIGQRRSSYPGSTPIAQAMLDSTIERYKAFRGGRMLNVTGYKQQTIVGIVAKLEKRKSKKNQQLLYFVDLEDESGSCKFIVNAHHLKNGYSIDDLKKGTPLQVVARKANQYQWAGYVDAETVTPLQLV